MGATTEREESVRKFVGERRLRTRRTCDGDEVLASSRTWPHRAATDTCPTAVEGRAGRPEPPWAPSAGKRA